MVSLQTRVICGDMQLLHVLCDGGMPPHFFAQGARINYSVYIDYCMYNSSTRSSGWPDMRPHDVDPSHKARVAQSSWLRIFMNVSFLTYDLQTLRIDSTISKDLYRERHHNGRYERGHSDPGIQFACEAG